MKGFRFYLEYRSKADKRKGKHAGNVLALEVQEDNGRGAGVPVGYFSGEQYVYSCIAAVYFHPNSGVCWTAVAPDVLSEKYKRISEKQAREIHPAMFKYLDS